MHRAAALSRYDPDAPQVIVDEMNALHGTELRTSPEGAMDSKPKRAIKAKKMRRRYGLPRITKSFRLPEGGLILALRVMSHTVPDWAIQTSWWISGIFATGALWYFLSIKDNSYAAGSGVLALVFALMAIALHRRKDRLAEKLLPTELKDEVPDDHVRRSLDEATDVRLLQALPELKAMACRNAQVGWDNGTPSEMRKATYDVVDFYVFIWLKLAEFYPVKHFDKGGASAYIKRYVRERYKFHWGKHESDGPGTGGTIVGVLTGSDVMNDLDRLIVETATAVIGYRDDFDLSAWHARWKDASPSHYT